MQWIKTIKHSRGFPAREDRIPLRRLAVIACGILLGHALSIQAAELPTSRLTSIFPAGGKQGTAVTVQVAGIDLDEPAALLFSHPGITAVQKTNPPRSFETTPQPVPNQFEVSIAADVPPGRYEVRVLARHGLSSPRAFVVGDLPEVVSDGRNQSIATAMKIALNTVMNAPATSGDFPAFYEVQGAAGEPILIRCAAIEIDSRLSAVLEVRDGAGELLASGRGTAMQDAVIHFTPPADGAYFLKIHDLTWRAGTAFAHRCEISRRPWIEFIWPPAGSPGSTESFTLYGYNLPGGSPVEEFPARPGFEKLTVSVTLPAGAGNGVSSNTSLTRQLNGIGIRGFEYRFSDGDLISNSAMILEASAPVVVGQSGNDVAEHAQLVPVPADVVGRFYPAQHVDWYAFQAVKGQSYVIDLQSERLNLPTDPSLSVWQSSKDAGGQEKWTMIREMDDPPPPFDNVPFHPSVYDPIIQFTAESDGIYRIQVRDLYAGENARPSNLYRLGIRPASPDFELLVTTMGLAEADPAANPQRAVSPTLRRGGTQVMTVQVFRSDGFQGPVTLTATGLPPGVTCDPVVVPAVQNQAPLVLSAALDAPIWAGTIQIHGTADVNGETLERTASTAAIIWDKSPPTNVAATRVVDDLMIALIAETSPLSVSPAELKIWETSRAGKLPIAARIDRRVETVGNLTLAVRGLPTGLFPLNKLPTLAVDQQAGEGTVEVTVPPQAAPGDYPCYLTAFTVGKYVRNPEAAVAAEEKKQQFEKLIAELTQALTSAEAAKTTAEQKLAALTAEPEGKVSAETLAAANNAKTEADAAVAKAMQTLSEAQAEFPAVVKRAADLANSVKPADIDLYAASQTFVIRIHELPVQWTATPPAAFHPGTEGEISIEFTRFAGFADAVTFDAQLPAGVPGLTVASVSIPAGEQAGKMIVKSTTETPPGDYRVVLVAKLVLNGQNLQAERPITIRVRAAQ